MSGTNNINAKNIQAVDSGTGSDKLLSTSITSFNFNGRLIANIEYRQIKNIPVGSVIFLQDPTTSSSPASYKISKISQNQTTLLYDVSYFSDSNLYETFMERSPLRNVSATIVAGVATVTVPSTAGMFVGVSLEKVDGVGVFGANYPVIQSIDSSTQITLTTNHTTSGSIVFNVMENRGKYIGTENFHVQVQDIDTNNLGTEGWAITSSGQSIFTDIYARGHIEASSGLISGILEVGTDNAEGSYMSIGTDIFSGEPFEEVAKQHNGIFINPNNYLLTYSPLIDKTTTSVVVTNPTEGRTRKTITLNLSSHQFVLGTTTDGSIDPTEYFVLSGLTGALAELNGTQRVTALTSTSVTFYIYSTTAFSSTYTGLSGSVQKFGNYDPYPCSSLSIASAADPVTYNLIRLNISANTLQVGELIYIDGLTGALVQLNSSFQVVTSNPSYIEVKNYGALITPNTYAQTGTISSLNNDTKFRIGSTENFMKYDSSLNSLTVSGTINASAGNFTNTVTIGQSSTQGKLQVGTGTSFFEIIGTNNILTTAIKTNNSTGYNTAGVWIGADGKFSLGNNQLYFDGANLFAPAITTTSLTVGTSPNQMVMSPTAIPGSPSVPGLYMTKTKDFISATTGNFSLGQTGLVWDGTKLNINGILTGYINQTYAAPIIPANTMGVGSFKNFTNISGTLSGTTLTVSEADRLKLSIGSTLTKVSGTGVFGTSTVIESILSSTEVKVTPTAGTNGAIVFNSNNAADGIYGTGLKINQYNYWFADSPGPRIRVGDANNYLQYSSGNLTVTGEIKATSGYIGGTTSGWEITEGVIQSSAPTNTIILDAGIVNDNPFISIGDQNYPSFYADSEGTLNIGSGVKSLTYNPEDGVTVQGTIKATSGFIGASAASGWQFGIDGSLQSGQGDDTVVLVSSGAEFGGGSSTVKINRILVDDEYQEAQELLGSIYMTVDLANVNASYRSLDPTEISTTGTFTSGGNTITVANATEIVNGMLVVGTGIAQNATVTNVSGTIITVTGNHTASGSGTPLTLVAQGFWDKYVSFSFANISSGIGKLLDGKRLIVQDVTDKSPFMTGIVTVEYDTNPAIYTVTEDAAPTAITEINPVYIQRSGTTLTFYTDEKLAGFTSYNSSFDLAAGQTITIFADSTNASISPLNGTTAVISSIETTPTYNSTDGSYYYKIIMTTATSSTLALSADFNALSFYKALSSTQRTLTVYPEDLGLNVNNPSLEGYSTYSSVSAATTGAIGSKQVTVSSNSSIVDRMSIIGTGIDPYSKVVGTPTTTTVNLSKANIAAVNSTVTFASASITFYDNYAPGSVGTYYMWAGDPDPTASSFSIVQKRSTKKIVLKADAGTTPVGSINIWATQNFPLGWRLCNGDVITYTEFPELYIALGGVSPYTATITVPDMRGRFPLGASSGTMPAGRLVKALGSAPSNAYTHNHTTSIAHNHSDNLSTNTHNHSDNLSTPNHTHADNFANGFAASSTTGSGSTFLYSGVAGTYRFHTHAIGGVVSNYPVDTNANAALTGNVTANNLTNQGGNISGSVTGQAATSTSTASQTEILPPYIPIHYIIYTGVI